MADAFTLDAEAWRERAEQLQTALDSRVVIERAKGMLRERFGLPIESAFELLRTAARGNGQKLHALAAEVVVSFATPEPIVRVLGHHPEFLTMPREVRIKQTEDRLCRQDGEHRYRREPMATQVRHHPAVDVRTEIGAKSLSDH